MRMYNLLQRFGLDQIKPKKKKPGLALTSVRPMESICVVVVGVKLPANDFCTRMSSQTYESQLHAH